MAFDGITVANLTADLKEALTGGGISRIIQPERDELMLVIKSNRQTYYLLLSANASLPLLYLTDEKKEAPMSAPNFCMLLRKHLQGGQILDITQPSLERIVIFHILHRDELGDLAEKKLIIELMGKYSNIIFTDASDVIIDSIKRIPSSISSVREVLPGRPYFVPESMKKADPLAADAAIFDGIMRAESGDMVHALSAAFAGISVAAAEEFVYEAGCDARLSYGALGDPEKEALTKVFLTHMDAIRQNAFSPNMVVSSDEPKEFGSFRYAMYAHPPYREMRFPSASEMILAYYGQKERATRIRQKSQDLRHVVTTALDRTNKKFAIQEKQLLSTEKRDKYRIYGEMLNTYGYGAKEGDKELICTNYYTDEEISVPLDPTISVQENAQKYFARYNKLKRTAEAVTQQIEETKNDREQLMACLAAIELAENETDLSDIRRELADFGFIQRKGPVKKGAKREAKSAPYLYRSSDGFLIYVGKNNYQNDELTFKTAGANDWWFHVKGAPGSHVIIKCEGRELPDRAFEEAGALAAYYSSKRKSPKVEIDYTMRKHLKKTNGGKPGFVIYHTNYSLMAAPDISGLKRLS